MDKKTYKELERLLAVHKLKEDTDEVFLELAEALEEKGIQPEAITVQLRFGKTKVEACGRCNQNEEDPEEVDVYMEWIQIGTEKILVEDYVL